MDVDNIIKDLSSEDSDFNKKCVSISEDVVSGSLPIVKLIEKLDFLITNTSPAKRELGVSVLAEVLSKLPTDFLNPQQVEVISSFFISKLKDHHQVAPLAIKGLIIVTKLKHYPPKHVPVLLTTMVDNIACQQQQQNDRYNIYKLFETLMENYTSDLLSMGLNFTYGIISSIDGERDPRNLLFLFKLMNKYLKIIPLGHLVEDMFDVLACYFPVDFKAPSNNSVITRENLAEGLCPCLCAVPEFGEPCLELALEKLDSSLDIAKSDSLELLREGCKNFTPKTYLENSYKIWSQIQKEIFTTTDTKYQQVCLEILTLVVNKMSHGSEEDFVKFLHDVLDTLKGNLLPEMKQYQISISILLHIAHGSGISSALIITEIVPILINTFIITSIHHKPMILESLVSFLISYFTQNKKQDTEISKSIILLCFQSISDRNENLRMKAFESFGSLAPYLPEDSKRLLFDVVSKYLVTPESESIRKFFNNCLLEISKNYGTEIETLFWDVQITDVESLDLYLTSLCTLATLDSFRGTSCKLFIKYLNDSKESACVAIKNMIFLLEKHQDDTDYLNAFIEKNIIGILIEFSVKHITDVSVQEILQDVSCVIKILIGCQDSLCQKVIVDHWLKRLASGLEEQESFVILLDGLVSRVNRDIDIDCDLWDKLFEIAISSGNERNRSGSVQLLANVMNKKSMDEKFAEYVESFKRKCEQLNSYNAFMMTSWITKALMLRNHTDALGWLSLLFNNLEKSPEAAKGFKILMNDTCDSLSSRSNSIITPLYQQKAFVYAIDKVSNDLSQIKKLQYQRTFGYLLTYVPNDVLLIYFKRISKLMLLCLEYCDNDEILLILLKTVKNIVLINKTEIEGHLEDYVTRILKLTQFQHSMKVRVESVQFITNLVSNFPVYKLLSVRKAVLKQLSYCVDDKKRLVRKEAMEATSLWYLLDSPME